jgi:Holliday junction resolvasome RuvABC endonuclease subunit
MKLLALDLANTTGWAIGENGVLLDSGSLRLAKKDDKHGDIWLRFMRWLDERRAIDGIQAIIYEKSFAHGIRNGSTAGRLNGLIALAEYWATLNELAYLSVPHSTWKKVATGKGNSTKEHTIAVINQMYGLHLGEENNDEADAIGVLTWAFEFAV